MNENANIPKNIAFTLMKIYDACNIMHLRWPILIQFDKSESHLLSGLGKHQLTDRSVGFMIASETTFKELKV